MGARSSIEWTDASWTPIRARNLKTGKIGWHCVHATTGCVFCYAENMNVRLGTGLPFKPGHRADIEIFLDQDMLRAPLRWKKPRSIFVCSMTDLFGTFVPNDVIDQIFAVIALTPWHIHQVLTKRADRMLYYLTSNRSIEQIYARACRMDQTLAARWQWPLPNVWLGVSAERQEEWDARTGYLRRAPATVRFVSAEPLLGPIDGRGLVGIDWLIVGGESGPHARPMHPDWARGLRDQCATAGVPLNFKQWGRWASGYRDRMGAGEMVFRQFTSFQQWVNKASGWVSGGICLDRDGTLLRNGADFMRARDNDRFPVTIMHPLGKGRAGRLLDGVEHNGTPHADRARMSV